MVESGMKLYCVVTLVLVAVALLGTGVANACKLRNDRDAATESRWEEEIQQLLDQHADAYDAHDVEGFVLGYTSDAHRLTPGKPVVIGAEAIKESFQQESLVAKVEMKLTYLRFYCDGHAVAEFSARDFSGLEIAKGVVVVQMKDEIPKISTWIYNIS